jgi:Glycosyltransferase like family
MSDHVPDVTFVVTKSGDPAIFERNFAPSACLEGIQPNRVIVQQGFPSAAAAYNAAIEESKTNLIVFSHQDVYFPANWLETLGRSLKSLDRTDPNWGVLGCSGVNIRGQWAAYLYSTGLGIIGRPFDRPIEIDTLDEFILILRKSSGLRFDPSLPHFHFYGTDICMTARKAGKKCYAIPAFSIHNTSYGPLSDNFFRCYWPVREKWKESLPIQTTCIRITRWNEDFILQRLKQIGRIIVGKNAKVLPRLEDPRSALRFEGESSPDDIEAKFIGPRTSPNYR